MTDLLRLTLSPRCYRTALEPPDAESRRPADVHPLWGVRRAQLSRGLAEREGGRGTAAPRALESAPSEDTWDFYNLTMVAAVLGEKDRAFAHLERWMRETREASFVDVAGPAWFDPLRDDPRFDRLVEELKRRQGLGAE